MGPGGFALCAVLVLAAVCAGGRRPAREIATREPDGSEWSISRPALALPPPTGTATMPRHRPRAPRPGPATAHGHRSQALRSLRRPPHLRLLVCCWLARRVASLSGQARRLLWASRGSRVLSFWGGLVCVVTNVVNLMAFWLKMVVTGQFAR